jgi:hypothetical protein
VIDPRWAPAGDQLAFVYVPGLGPADQVRPPGQQTGDDTQAIYRFDTSSGRLTRLSR